MSFFRRQSTKPKDKFVYVYSPDHSCQTIKIDRNTTTRDVIEQVIQDQLILVSKRAGTTHSDRSIMNEVMSKYKYALYEYNDKKEKQIPENANIWEKHKKDNKFLFKSPRGDPLPRQAQLVHTLQVIESPITTITRILNELLKKDHIVGSPLEAQLQQILLLVSTQELYKVDIKSPETDNSPVVLDQLTQSFLRTEFGTNTTKLHLPPRESVCLNFNLTNKTVNPELEQWGFDVWKYSKADCIPLIISILNHYQLIDHFKIDTLILTNFLHEIIVNYHDNPYHNFHHAMDVTQTVFSLISHFEASKLLSQMDILVVLISALCHDIDHPGLNNSYQANMVTELALHWNDQVILENHHASFAFKLLNKPENNILSGLTREEYKEFRKLMIDLILVTDMASHFTFINKFKQRISVLSERPFNPNSYEDRYLITSMILKCSDISNVAKPWEYSKIWADRVSVESFAQGDREKKLGLPVAPFMDRDQSTPAKNTANFIDFMAGPSYEILETLLPKVTLCNKIIRDNRGRWERLLHEGPSMQPPNPSQISLPNLRRSSSDKIGNHDATKSTSGLAQSEPSDPYSDDGPD